MRCPEVPSDLLTLSIWGVGVPLYRDWQKSGDKCGAYRAARPVPPVSSSCILLHSLSPRFSPVEKRGT